MCPPSCKVLLYDSPHSLHRVPLVSHQCTSTANICRHSRAVGGHCGSSVLGETSAMICFWLFSFVCHLIDVMSQFSSFEVGQVKAHMHHGLGAVKISRILLKPDGKSQWSVTAVQDCMDKLNADSSWRGERAEGSGPPRATTKAQDKQLVKYVLAERGRRKVTIGLLRTQFAWLKGLSDSLVADRLGEADLAWLRRRGKSIATKTYIPERLAYCKLVAAKQQRTLDTWAYTDGTTFYLDRTSDENEHTQRAALGGFVWRRTDGRDAMFAECLGPSSYAKAQGYPVRVWGMLVWGHLYIHVLEAGEVMNEDVYTELIEDKFEGWLDGSSYLVQDFERCLRCPKPLHALEQLNVELVEGYPRCSQDFNAIENMWKILRGRLAATLPLGVEDREAFITRLHSAVRWMNRHERKQLWYLSRNQKERCRDCVLLKGGRTKW